jgi:hypothetical protein
MSKYWPWIAAIGLIMALNVAAMVTFNDKEIKPKQLVCVIESGGWQHIHVVDNKRVRIEEMAE